MLQRSLHIHYSDTMPVYLFYSRFPVNSPISRISDIKDSTGQYFEAFDTLEEIATLQL
jgi:hypothetical protein